MLHIPRLQTPTIHDPHWKGLRAVALLEFAKGVIVVLAYFGLISLVHRDLWEVTESMLEVLHIDPNRYIGQAFLYLADRITDMKWWTIAAVVAAYTSLRFVEAYGLWRARAWAEWIALVSGSFYLPFEIYELARKPTLLHGAVLLINIVIVLYMLYLRTWGRTEERPQYQPGD